MDGTPAFVLSSFAEEIVVVVPPVVVAPTFGVNHVKINWLLANFELRDNSSLPRSYMFTLYQRYGINGDSDPLNAASFGKLMKNVFPSVTARRLGTRGQSRYHYYGIGIKESSPLYSLPEPDGPFTSPAVGEKRKALGSMQKHIQIVALPTFSKLLELFLEKSSIERDLEVDPELRDPTQTNKRNHFLQAYYDYSLALVNDIISLDVEKVTKTVQKSLHLGIELNSSFYDEQMTKLLLLFDNIIYQTLFHIFVPKPFEKSTHVDSELMMMIERLQTLSLPLPHAPDTFQLKKKKKMETFCTTLYLHCVLNSLSGIFCQILDTEKLVFNMVNDIQQTNLVHILRKVELTLNIPQSQNNDIINQIRVGLQMKFSLSAWLTLLESIFKEYFLKTVDTSLTEVESGKESLSQFIAFTSILVNDLTFRNAPSFGSFHIMKTFFEEYCSLGFLKSTFNESPFVPKDNPLPDGVAISYLQQQQPYTQSQWNEDTFTQQTIVEQVPVMPQIHHSTPTVLPLPNATVDPPDVPRTNPLYYFPHENIQRNSPFDFHANFTGNQTEKPSEEATKDFLTSH